MKFIPARAALGMGLVCAAFAQNPGWFKALPESPSQFLYEPVFVDARVGYAAQPYRASPIYKTVNGGFSWSPLDYGMQMGIASVHFPRTSLTGYALGQDSVTFVKTTDGGATWTRWRSTHPVAQLHFVNDSTAFAISGDRLVRTFDSAKTWQERFPPLAFAGYDGFRLFFGNADLGLLSMFDKATHAGRLFKTANAGASWTEIPGAPYLQSFKFIDQDTGYATGTMGLDDLRFRWYRAFRTTDGGLTWNIIHSAPQTQGPTGPLTLSWISGVAMPDKSTVYILENLGSQQDYSEGRILKSVDGGATWTRDFTIYAELYSLQFPDAHTGYAGVSIVGETAALGALLKHVDPVISP